VFNLQGSEIVVILLLALVVLGPEKLPDAVRKFTQTYSELKKMSSGFQSELKSALDEPMREMRETANLVRDAADPKKLMAEADAEQRVLDDADAAVGRLGAPTPINDWAAPVAGSADPSRNGDSPFEPVADPGATVATPGDPPDDPAGTA
jgi:sec-independent protein translocase protein TatB